MQDIFTKLIEQLNSSVFVLLTVLILAFYAVYKLGSWKQLFLTHNGRIEKVERIADTVISIQTKVDLIYQYSNPNATVKSASPTNLTKVGAEIVEKINAKDIFKKYAMKLIGIVESKNPQNAYDIQQISFAICKKELLNFFNENELKMVKEEAFSRGILMEDVMAVFGILLRNKILEDRKIPVTDIDKHAERI